MVVMRIAVLCGCGLALGGCLSLPDTPRAFSSLPLTAVSNGPLPPVTEPGQILRPDLGRTSASVDPSDDLRSSERARVAWAPLYPKDFVLRSSTAARVASEQTKAANTMQPSKTVIGRAARTQPYDRERAMDRLEREGQRGAKPICGGC